MTRQGYLEVIEQLCEILSYLRAELLRMTWAEVTHPEDLAVDIASFNRVLAGEAGWLGHRQSSLGAEGWSHHR